MAGVREKGTEDSMNEEQVIASTFDGVMDVYERRYKEGKLIQEEEEALLYKGFPCAVSRSRSGARYGNQPVKQGQAAALNYETKVFASPKLSIPAGCSLVVTQYGKTVRYVTCGEPVRYPTHQEILVAREDYA